jgi:4'-phosphopantetheinyl transferase
MIDLLNPDEDAADFFFSTGHLDVWKIDLAGMNPGDARIEACLSGDEKRRAASFKFKEQARRFRSVRYVLRYVLGALYLRIDPRAVVLSFNAWGKPALKNPSPSPLCFNLSHADDRSLLAISPGHEVGIDVECMHPLDEADGIVETSFSPDDARHWRETPPERRVENFYAQWTRKEAYLKARGCGLGSLPDDAAMARLNGGKMASRPLSIRHGDAVWHLADLPLETGWRAALCVEDRFPPVRIFDATPVLAGAALRAEPATRHLNHR